MTKPPTTHRTPTETDAALARGGNQQAAERAAARVAALDDTTPSVPGGPTGNGAPTHQGASADPTPAATPVASANLHPRDGDRAGAGRPTRDGKGRFLVRRDPAVTLARSAKIPEMGAALAQALLDAQAETHRVDTATRTQAVLVAAVRFGDVVRHGGGDGS